jgi:hypothetical protein
MTRFLIGHLPDRFGFGVAAQNRELSLINSEGAKLAGVIDSDGSINFRVFIANPRGGRSAAALTF